VSARNVTLPRNSPKKTKNENSRLQAQVFFIFEREFFDKLKFEEAERKTVPPLPP